MAAKINSEELMQWLDWMDFVKGLDVGYLNNLALAEPSDDDFYVNLRKATCVAVEVNAA